jgi:pre-mRNA branch site protein p14
VLYHKPAQQAAKLDLAKREKELEELKKAHNIPDKE